MTKQSTNNESHYHYHNNLKHNQQNVLRKSSALSSIVFRRLHHWIESNFSQNSTKTTTTSTSQTLYKISGFLTSKKEKKKKKQYKFTVPPIIDNSRDTPEFSYTQRVSNMPSSIHSGISGRSVGSLASTLTTRSKRSIAASQKLKLKWWQRRPILKTAYLLDLQKGSYAAAIFTLAESVLLLFLSLFDLYCLLEARPGSRHFRSFGFSFLFVYSGNRYVRYALILTTSLLSVAALALFMSSCIIIPALKKEYELKFRPWLLIMTIFVTFRTFATLFQSIANDLYFTYHQAMLLLWLILIPLNVFALLVVYSNYQELSDITKIEDMAKLKMSTLSSLQGSRTLSHMSNQSLDSTYRHYGATGINSNPSPSYMRAAANINHQPHYGTTAAGSGAAIGAASTSIGGHQNVYGNYNPTGSIIYGGSNLSTPTPSVLAHHASTPSLRGGAAYTIPLEMFNLNRPGSVTSSNQQINQEFIWPLNCAWLGQSNWRDHKKNSEVLVGSY